MAMTKPNELVTVHPDGSITRKQITPEESQRLHEKFCEEFDPETMERRSFQEFKKKHIRPSSPAPPPPLQPPAGPS
jgi:hypothetical protein